MSEAVIIAAIGEAVATSFEIYAAQQGASVSPEQREEIVRAASSAASARFSKAYDDLQAANQKRRELSPDEKMRQYTGEEDGE